MNPFLRLHTVSLFLLLSLGQIFAFPSQGDPPIHFVQPPSEVFHTTRTLDFGLVSVGSNHQDSTFEVVSTSPKPVQVMIATDAPGISVTPTQFTLDQSNGGVMPITVSWLPQTGMALDHEIVFSTVINGSATGSLSWQLLGRAGDFHIEINGQPRTSFDFGEVPIGQVASQEIRLINHTNQNAFIATSLQNTEIALVPSAVFLPFSGTVDTRLEYTPSELILNEVITFSNGQFSMDFVVEGHSPGQAELALFDTQGNPLSSHDFGEFTLKIDSPLIEVEVRNIGNAPTSSKASITGFELPSGAVFCTNGEINICAQDTQTGFRPDIRNLAPGDARVLRFYVTAQIEGPFERHFEFEDGPTRTELSLVGQAVPFLLPRWQSTLDGATPPSNGDYLTNPMGPKLANGLGLNSVFSFNDIDNINVFNGNLVLNMPIGQHYPGGGELTYGLSLVYNANAWDMRFKEERQPPGIDIQASVVSPDPKSNAGLGFSLHLGRLFPPMDEVTYGQLSQTEQEKQPHVGSSWLYVGPDNASHLFHYELHQPGIYEPNPATAYTRDGSYLRMVDAGQVNGFSIREVQFPDGSVHVFQERDTWGDSWIDSWRLIAVRDPHGNQVTIHYEGMTWRIEDEYNRNQFIHFEADSYWDRRVRAVHLTAFDQQTAIYLFQYSTHQIPRPGDTFLGHNGTVTVSMLDRVILPDQTTYEFDYRDVHERQMEKVTLPTDATVEWEYSRFAFPFGPECNAESEASPPRQSSVAKRVVRDQYGSVQDTRHFLRGFYDGTGIQPQFCSEVFSNFWLINPKAEMAVGVFNPTGTHSGRLEMHYFSVWPFGEGPNGLQTQGGWTNREFGKPFTRNQPDPLDPERFLSTQTYGLSVGSITGTEDPKQLANTGQLMRSKYLAFEQEYSNCANLDPSNGCGDVNQRIVQSSEIYHDDNNKRASTIFSDFDGLGNFRKKETWGNIGNDHVKYETKYHPWRGTLKLLPDGRISPQSTFIPLGASEPWILQTFTEKKVTDDQGLVRATKYKFNANNGLLMVERILKSGTSDHPHDLVRVHSYNTKGERKATRYFGGDVQELPVGQGPDHDFAIDSTPQGHQYKTIQSYVGGVLATSRYEGFDHFVTNNTHIDANTGLVKTFTDSTNTIPTTHTYDTMGRLTKIISAHDANQVITYKLPGVDNWTQPPKVLAYQYRNGTQSGANNRLSENVIFFDNMGRIIREDKKHPDGYFMRNDFTYNQRSWLIKASTTQRHNQFNGAKASHYEYDLFGRLTKATNPDGSVIRQAYRGNRQVTIRSDIGTDYAQNGSLIQNETVQTLTKNRQGRITSIATPNHTTYFDYDPLGQLIEAQRGNQTRIMTVDGRGLQTKSQLPEKGQHGNGFVEYFDFDALGNPGRVRDGLRELEHDYDGAGRLILTRDGTHGGPILERHFSTTPGPSLGKLATATRYNYVGPENTGGAIAVADTRAVTEDYFYTNSGRMNQRDTLVTTGSGLEVASFSQAWTFNDLGLVDTISYPECLTNDCWDTSRTVTHTYQQGALVAVAPGSVGGATLDYHDNGMLHRVNHGNGLVDQYGKPTSGIRRLASMNLAGNQFGLEEFHYDGSGNITKIGADKFTYDLNSRLTRADIPGPPIGNFREYDYDQFDNLTQIGPDTLDPNGNNNRLNDLTYDPSGNTTEVGAYAMFYDAMGMQESMIYNPSLAEDPCDLGTPSGDCWLYWYGPDNLRVGGISLLEDGSGDYFWTLRNLDGTVLRTYKSLTGTLTFTQDFIYANGSLISSKDIPVNSEKHYHNDHLGTPRGVSDRWGTFLGSRHYTAFGTPSGIDGVEEKTVDWTGHEKDPNDLTHYMKARTYFNGWGRFMTPDPARDGWNLYTYARNNPINRTDPTGLSSTQGNQGLSTMGNECLQEDPACDKHTIMGTLPNMTHIEGPPEDADINTYYLGGSDGKYQVSAGSGYYVETANGKFSDIGLGIEISINLDILQELPIIVDGEDVTINLPFLTFEKKGGNPPLFHAEAYYRLNDIQSTISYDTNAPGVQRNVASSDAGIPGANATVSMRLSGRDVYNGWVTFFNGVKNSYPTFVNDIWAWAKSCKGFCNH